MPIAVCIAALLPRPAAAQSPSLAVIVERVFGYVERFQRDFGSMVAEERYEQVVRQTAGSLSRGESRRVLRSDFLLVNVPGQGWLPFRDVFEADGRQVRDRQERLTSLFLSGPTTQAFDQARRIMDEGARYNIGNGSRNINIPTLALMYLTPDHRSRVRFTERKGEGEARVLDFDEVGRPALIGTTGGRDLPARGRLWVDPETGTITRTELHADDPVVEVAVSVTFQLEPTLGVWVPQRMEDRFKRRGDTAEVRGTATYSRFRRFQVSTSEELTPPETEGKP